MFALMMFDCSRGQCRSTLVMCTLLYTPLLIIRDCDQPITVTTSSHEQGLLGLTAAVSACADQQFGTNFHSRSTDTREQFKHRLKGWLFECAYGRTRVR